MKLKKKGNVVFKLVSEPQKEKSDNLHFDVQKNLKELCLIFFFLFLQKALLFLLQELLVTASGP